MTSIIIIAATVCRIHSQQPAQTIFLISFPYSSNVSIVPYVLRIESYFSGLRMQPADQPFSITVCLFFPRSNLIPIGDWAYV